MRHDAVWCTGAQVLWRRHADLALTALIRGEQAVPYTDYEDFWRGVATVQARGEGRGRVALKAGPSSERVHTARDSYVCAWWGGIGLLYIYLHAWRVQGASAYFDVLVEELARRFVGVRDACPTWPQQLHV